MKKYVMDIELKDIQVNIFSLKTCLCQKKPPENSRFQLLTPAEDDVSRKNSI